MVHLNKLTLTKSREGIELDRLACVNDPFVRGLTVFTEEFGYHIVNGSRCCKKCLKIL